MNRYFWMQTGKEILAAFETVAAAAVCAALSVVLIRAAYAEDVDGVKPMEPDEPIAVCEEVAEPVGETAEAAGVNPVDVNAKAVDVNPGTVDAYTETASDADIEYLAIAIYCEAGADWVSDITRYYVGDVILNRVDSEEFPGTVYEVLTQEYAYGVFAWTGVVWPEYSRSPWEARAIERAYDTARDLLVNGNHTWLYGSGYIWQSEYQQSENSFYLDGFWFGK